MTAKIYVENIAPTTTKNELKHLFSTYGNVAEVDLVVEPTQPKPRGLAFVTMVTPEGARAAILALHERRIAEYTLAVTEVKPNKERNGLLSPTRKSHRDPVGLAKSSFKGAL
jgi:RNA recognition motif-containing protein